jgi:biopolymer transport protein ExbD
MRLRRQTRTSPAISLVSMIDVLLIMLVFFMVTSTFLNLRMLPMARTAEAPSAGRPAPTDTPILIRIDAEGVLHLQGRAFAGDGLTGALREMLDQAPERTVLVFPSGHARTQALVDAIDRIAASGATRLRVIRVEGGS